MFLLFNGVTKLMKVSQVVEAIAQLGYPETMLIAFPESPILLLKSNQGGSY